MLRAVILIIVFAVVKGKHTIVALIVIILQVYYLDLQFTTLFLYTSYFHTFR